MTDSELEAKRLLTEILAWFNHRSPGDLGDYPECLDSVVQWLKLD